MKTETKTSFGDKNRSLNIKGMRDLLDANWASRDRSFFRSPAERDGLLNPDASSVPAEEDAGFDRRDFMKYMGGTMALAGLTACTKQPEEKIVPYVDAPEEIVPGKPLFYATAFTMGGFAQGLMAESHMGRPTKVEGNPRHPASLGATGTHAQASVLDLYDPDRSQGIFKKGVAGSFNTFKTELTAQLEEASGLDGEGLHLVLGPSTSPSEAAVLAAIQKAYPKAGIHRFDALGMDNALRGAEFAFGKPLQQVPQLAKADVVLTLDADFLAPGPDAVRLSHEYASRRRVVDHAKLNRVYAVESTITMTGGNADHRLAIRADRVEAVARALAADSGVGGTRPELTPKEETFVSAVLADLKHAGSHGLVLAGDHQPPIVHAIALAINATLGSIGTTLTLIEPLLLGPLNAAEDFAALVADMKAGTVSALLMLGINPVHGAAGDQRFEAALKKVPFSVHVGPYRDETAEKSTWHIASTHFLETWSDACAIDGTITIAQPLIAPLYAGKSILAMLALVAGDERSAYEVVQQYWKDTTGFKEDDVAFNSFWRTSLHDGFVAKSVAASSKKMKLDTTFLAGVYSDQKAKFGLEVVIRSDASVLDGQFSNNAWLQELPRPVSTLSWDHVLVMSAKTAQDYRIDVNEDGVQDRIVVNPKVPVVQLSLGDATITGPVLVLPGHPDESITVTLGGGRTTGAVAKGIGYNAAAVRTTDAPWIAQGARLLHKGRVDLALTQDHFVIKNDGRGLVRQATADQYKKNPEFAGLFDHLIRTKEADAVHGDEQVTLYPAQWDYSKGNQWGMVIDLSTCIGCNTCVSACQSENNIPTVGKSQIMNGREMYWVRVDRYTEESENGDVRVHSQPIPCMQCENASCETVCPVGATMHSNDGLNMMVYNRCVGTRYCSNNCPFKVRRYNFHKYTDDSTESLKFQRNPDVTVRLRGVMEKCTYCVQRINLARIDAKVEMRDLRDGEIKTACQQACPTQAISFGDINDPNSRVTHLKADGLNYTLLNNLNMRPRTSYLAKVRNPNTVLEPHPKPLPVHHGGGHDDHAPAHGPADASEQSHDDHGHA